jgi:anti-anti-sigma regulatory factor
MTACFELPAELNIYTAAETAQAMTLWFAENRNQQTELLTLDGHAVAEVDAAGLQLLAALHNTCKSHALQWQLTQASQTLGAACTRLGIPVGTSA